MSDKGSTPIVGNEKGDMEMGRSGPPPDYGSSTKGNGNTEEPPAYGSWFEKWQYAKDNSEGPMQFPLKSLKVFMGKDEGCKQQCNAQTEQKKEPCGTVFWALFNMGIPIAMVVIGAIYFSDCPLERHIPIYLIVSGGFQIFRIVLETVVSLCKQYRTLERDEKGELKLTADMKALNSFHGMVGGFLFIFFIVGNVWVYSNWAPSNNPLSPRWCNHTLYYFAFWNITGTYIFFGLVLLFVCLCCFVGCMAICCCKKS